MHMKLIKISAAVLSAGMLFGAASAQAADPVTTAGGVAFTSDYLFRGVSQSSNNAAVQGALTVNHESGVYFTAWGSSIASYAGGLELDTLLGYAGKAGDVGYDVGVMRYNYPGLNDNTSGVVDKNGNSVDADYNEIYASVSFMGAKLGLNYSPDYYLESDKFVYVFADYATEVSQGFGVVAHVGFNKFDDESMMSQGLALLPGNNDDSYVDYKLGVTKSALGLGFELAYIGSDIDDDVCGGNLCEGRAVLTASKSF